MPLTSCEVRSLDFDEVIDGQKIKGASSGSRLGSAYLHTLRKSQVGRSSSGARARNDSNGFPRAASYQHPLAIGNIPLKSSAGATFYGAQSSASAIERRKGHREE